MVSFVQKERAGVIRMYEKQGTPPCGAFNAYIWNSCMDEIAGVITDIALLRVNELHFSAIPQEKLACAELRTISFEQTINIKIDGNTGYFTSAFFGEFVLHTCDQADAPGVEDAARLWVSCKLILTPGRHGLEVLQVSPTIHEEMVERPLLPLPAFPGVRANQYLLPDLSGINDETHQEALEQEAERFLMQYCKEALECPKPVPIRKIAEDKMGLTLITDKAVRRKGETEDSLMQRYQYSELEADCEQAFTEEELERHRAGFEQFVKEESTDDLAPPEKTFCELLVPHMTFETGTDFEAETGVKRTKLKQILDGEFNNPKVRTVVAICAGLNLDIVVTTELLRSAGHILLNTREHWAYKYIIVCGEGMLLDERNSILIALGVAPLGSRMTGG